MNSADVRIWSGSILVAAFFHGLLFMSWNNPLLLSDNSNIETHQITRLVFKTSVSQNKPSTLVDEVAVEIEKVKKPTPVLNPVRPEIIEPVLPEKPVVVEKVVLQDTSDIPDPAVTQTDKVIPAEVASANKAITYSYFESMLMHIEKFKFYPASARRRGVQGNVKVKFILKKNGSITELRVSSRYAALSRAATAAIKSALLYFSALFRLPALA